MAEETSQTAEAVNPLAAELAAAKAELEAAKTALAEAADRESALKDQLNEAGAANAQGVADMAARDKEIASLRGELRGAAGAVAGLKDAKPAKPAPIVAEVTVLKGTIGHPNAKDGFAGPGDSFGVPAADLEHLRKLEAAGEISIDDD